MFRGDRRGVSSSCVAAGRWMRGHAAEGLKIGCDGLSIRRGVAAERELGIVLGADPDGDEVGLRPVKVRHRGGNLAHVIRDGPGRLNGERKGLGW
jgi:hypothetical protein